MRDTETELYKELYHILFNAITDALEDMYRQDYAHAGLHLQLTQRKVEEKFMIWEDEIEKK